MHATVSLRKNIMLMDAVDSWFTTIYYSYDFFDNYYGSYICAHIIQVNSAYNFFSWEVEITFNK